MITSLESRFWDKVLIGDGCWEWTGSKNHDGYGSFQSFRKAGLSRSQGAHRISWELLRGHIPKPLTIDHLCRNRGCVNPEHMEAVPIGINTLRGETIPARNAAKILCKRGHLLIEENKKSRICLICKDVMDEKYRNMPDRKSRAKAWRNTPEQRQRDREACRRYRAKKKAEKKERESNGRFL